MGKSKDLATGETRFVNTTGDTMTGNLAINNASGSQVTLHRSDTTIVNDDLVGQIIMSGDDADTDASGTRGYIRGRSQGTGGGLKMEFGTAGGGVAMGSDPRMTINADGYVTKPSQPAWRIGRGSTVTVTNGHNTHSAINFNLTSDTTRRFFTQGGITISSGVVTVPVAGVYNVGYAVRFDGVGSGYGVTTIGINGSHSGSEGSYNLKGNSGFSSNYHTWTENTIFKLDAGDTIRVYYYQSADTSFTINYLSYFSGYLLG